MADIKLFQVQMDSVRELSAESLAIEKSLQLLLEKHLESFLGVRFLASEYSTGIRGRIFEEFYSHRPGRQASSGLGLSFVKRVIDAHGGKVQAIDGLGVGHRLSILDEATANGGAVSNGNSLPAAFLLRGRMPLL